MSPACAATHQDAYGPYARIYDRLWGPQVPAAVLPALERWLLAELAPGARILDLCCGTGQLTQALGDRGYRVVGIDSSPAMLSFARANAPDGELLLADARSFSVSPPCQGAISVSDSLNHLTSLEDLSRVFARVHDALTPGGLFLFDFFPPAGFHRAGETQARVEEDYVLITRIGSLSGERLLRFDTTLFYREGSWRRWDSVAYERLHTRSEIEELLTGAGFVGLRYLDAARELNARGLGDRHYFLCRRRGAQGR